MLSGREGKKESSFLGKNARLRYQGFVGLNINPLAVKKQQRRLFKENTKTIKAETSQT